MSLSTTLKEEIKKIFGDKVAFDIPLNQYTSVRVGGPADCLIWPENEEEVTQIVTWIKDKKLPHFVLGKGSNTLVKDNGFRGIVINLTKGFRNFKLEKENGHTVWVKAQGGVPTQQFVRWCADEGFTGTERLAGVPGTIGGNVYMNAGTHLGEIGELVEEAKICDSKGKIQTWNKQDLQFEYRSSNIPYTSVVLETLLKLQKGERQKIEETIKEVFEKRGLAQPVELPNLGSVFKNPPKKKAWELVEEAGCRGVRVGKARISEKHANFIINEGGAKAKDILILIGMVKDKVKEATGITLETEIKIIGE